MYSKNGCTQIATPAGEGRRRRRRRFKNIIIIIVFIILISHPQRTWTLARDSFVFPLPPPASPLRRNQVITDGF